MRRSTFRAAGSAAAALTLLTTLALGQSEPYPPPTQEPSLDDRSNHDADADDVDVPEVNSDAEIVAMVMAVDEHEIKAAKAIEDYKMSTGVRNYSKTMRDEHAKNLRDMKALASRLSLTPQNTPEIDRFNAQSKTDIAAVRNTHGFPELEKAYMAQMEQDHRNALAMLDDYIDEADNESLREQLRKTREHVAMHLEQAEALNTLLSAANTPLK